MGPMAEGLARKEVENKKLPVKVGSFGVWASEGWCPSTHGVNICKEHDIDISHLRSANIESFNLNKIDNLKIVCMSEWHRDDVLQYGYQNGVEKITGDSVVLMDNINNEDVYDPVGSPRARYEEVFDFIEPHVARHVDEFAEAIENPPEVIDDIWNN